jgi:hypothetical protein
VRGPVWIAAALVASFALALPAAATDGRTVTGVVVSVSSSAVAVRDAKGVVTTCALAPKSPSLAGYSAGDRVQARCIRGTRHLVLAHVRHLAASAGSTDETLPVTFAGAITALTDGSISLHDGDRDLTCAIGASSPSTAGYAVGQHARVACVNHTLAKIAPVTAPAPVSPPKPTEPPHTTVGALGTLTSLTTTAVTVHTDGGEVTCAIGDGSPALGDFHVGDRVKMGCVDGKLVALAKPDVAPAPPVTPPTLLTAAGTITVLSTAGLTVHNAEHGDVTCTLSASSPGLGDYHLGDHVGIACADGVLAKIVRLT